MSASPTSLFCKMAICPSSQSLLAYHQFRTSFRQTRFIGAHLASCDFCSAELQLLRRHRENRDEYSFAEMPNQLRRLAEGLLKKSVVPFGLFPELEEHREA